MTKTPNKSMQPTRNSLLLRLPASSVSSISIITFLTKIYKPLFFTLCFIWFASLAFAGAEQDYTVALIDADEKKGFNFPYVLRIPVKAILKERNYLVVESNNTGSDDDFSNQIDAALASASGSGVGPHLATELGVPLLVPVFPRTKIDWKIYTHALDRDTLLLQNESRERLDRQLLKMVEDAQERLAQQEKPVDSRFAIVGFSASGTFSNRFAMLHPEKLLAVVSGAVNSFPMLPIRSLHGRTLNYPLGVSDIKKISGRDFQRKDWITLPQMIFMGADDDNDAVKHDDAYSAVEREIIYQCLGENMDERWQEAQEHYLRFRPNVSFITYGQVGHWTDGRINGDIVNFIKIAMQRASANNAP